MSLSRIQRSRSRQPRFSRLAFLLAFVLPCVLPASRIKDLTLVEGARDNQLNGYGIVIGLAGNGDSKLNYTLQSIANALRNYGIIVDANLIKAKNVAAVMLTADIPPDVQPGNRIDVTVSSIGDASSLQGGVLLQAPLYGADGVVYAVSQGPLNVGGFVGGEGGPGGATVQQNHPTVGRIPSGAIVERPIPSEVLKENRIQLALRNPDYVTAVRIAETINRFYPSSSQAIGSGAVSIEVPDDFIPQLPNFLASIGILEAMPDTAARVVINERTGTIVATQNVRISRVAISHGSLTISVSNNQAASQPAPFSEQGETVVLNSTQTVVHEARGTFQVVDDLPTIDELTTALNTLGVSNRDMISILQALKSAGALQAELVVQ